ncbi:MAG TPA: hypothetical protein VLG68_09025 [Gammaproteobacteria bacterium]|nr:hypothetical protein [Gammaproteobacteria bacterium]
MGLLLLCTAGAAALLVSCTSLIPQGEKGYIGQNPVLVFTGKQLLDQTPMQLDEDHPNADWGLALVWFGDHFLLSADRNVTPGLLTQSFQVQAIADIPLLKRGQMIALGSCRENGRPISRVTAVVQYDHTQEWFTDIVAAWAYDPSQNIFIEYPTQNLRCLNRLFGVDLTPPPVSALLPSAAAPPGY